MFIITASTKAMDNRREQRIHQLCRRFGIRTGTSESFAEAFPEAQEHGEVGWEEIGSNHELTFYIVTRAGDDERYDEREHATRLASELRACGLMVSVVADEDDE